MFSPARIKALILHVISACAMFVLCLLDSSGMLESAALVALFSNYVAKLSVNLDLAESVWVPPAEDWHVRQRDRQSSLCTPGERFCSEFTTRCHQSGPHTVSHHIPDLAQCPVVLPPAPTMHLCLHVGLMTVAVLQACDRARNPQELLCQKTHLTKPRLCMLAEFGTDVACV